MVDSTNASLKILASVAKKSRQHDAYSSLAQKGRGYRGPPCPQTDRILQGRSRAGASYYDPIGSAANSMATFTPLILQAFTAAARTSQVSHFLISKTVQGSR